MTRSKITGTVTQTVVIGTPEYPSPLTVAQTGVVHPTAYGTTGIYAPSGLTSVTIVNHGEVFGAYGAADFGFDRSSSSGTVLAGGIGVDLKSTAALKNSGTISGGYGGYVNRSVSYAGGDAVVLSAGGYVSNTGSILGGVGGYAYYGPAEVGGVGVDISSAGTLMNEGLIKGGQGGFEDWGGNGGAGIIMDAGNVTNEGTIIGGVGGAALQEEELGGDGGAGVTFASIGTLTNSGLISGAGGGSGQYSSEAIGGIGVDMSLGGVLSNSGTIKGANSATAVVLNGEGTVRNSGLISGGNPGYTYYSTATGGIGVDMSRGGVLSNSGTIIGGGFSAAAVFFSGEGTLNNSGIIGGGYIGAGSGSLSSGVGVYLGGSDSFTDSGGIFGGANSYNKYYPSGSGGIGLVVVGASSVMVTVNGSIRGGIGGTSKYYYGGNGGAGVFLDGGTLSVSGTVTGGAAGYSYGKAGLAGDAVQFGAIAGTLAITSKAVFQGDIVADSAVNDTLVLDAGSPGTVSGLGTTITGFNTIQEAANAHWTLQGTITGTGAIDIGSGARLTIDAPVSIPTIAFAGPADLTLDLPNDVTTTFTGFSTGDIIKLIGIQASSLTFNADTLTLLNAAGSVVDTLAFTGKYHKSDFALQPLGKNTEIVFAGPYVPGTGPLPDFHSAGALPSGTPAWHASLADQEGGGATERPDPINIMHAWHAQILSPV